MELKIKQPTNDNHIPECDLFPQFETEAEFNAWKKEGDRLAKEQIRQGLFVTSEEMAKVFAFYKEKCNTK